MHDKKGKNFSANNAKGQRKKSDFYETPYSITSHLLKVESFDTSLIVCEPACGSGAIVKILEKEWKDVVAYDIEKNFLMETEKYDYIITNPPFSLAYEFVQKAKQVATKITGTVANPSRPSVKLTALEDPTIINTEKGMKNQPRFINKFLKNGKYKFFKLE